MLGLVAANAQGKSSLLAVLAAQMDPTSGTVTRGCGLELALVAQGVLPALLPLTLRDAVLDALPANVADCESWRSALLVRAAVMEPNLYLLDAPTSHLNLSPIGLLQRWLTGLLRDAGVNFTCNDCTFLAELTKSTLFLRETGSRFCAFRPPAPSNCECKPPSREYGHHFRL